MTNIERKKESQLMYQKIHKAYFELLQYGYQKLEAMKELAERNWGNDEAKYLSPMTIQRYIYDSHFKQLAYQGKPIIDYTTFKTTKPLTVKS